MNDFTLKYRPQTFEEVVGQTDVVNSLMTVLDMGTSRSFIFEGPSGCGKTTLARIVALELGCDPGNIIEVDAATRTSVNDVRDLTQLLGYRPLGKSKTRIIVLDEAHMLSSNAWNALLKAIEEPPEGVYWAFCTTESAKIPKTIRTRCTSFVLGDVSPGDLIVLLDEVCAAEAESGETPPPEEVRDLVVQQAEGSPRAALAALAQVWDCETRQAAALVLKHATTTPEAVELCRALAAQKPWPQTIKLVQALGDVNPESVRHMVCGYFEKVALSAKNPESALAVLAAFSEPYPPRAARYHLLLSIGELYFNG